MLRMFTLGLVVALAAPLSSQVAAETGCNAEPGCAAPGCCPAGCCCPQCGCHEGMVPVCHIVCTTAKVKKYKYTCKCDTVCFPPCEWECTLGKGHHCGCGCGSSCTSGCGCAAGCGCDGSNGCGCESECCNCKVRDIHKLVKCEYTVDVPVRKCVVEWVCPNCGCNCGCTEGGCAAPSAAPAAPTPPPAPPVPGKSAANDLPGGLQPAGANFAY